jgi:hypothetical protein
MAGRPVSGIAVILIPAMSEFTRSNRSNADSRQRRSKSGLLFDRSCCSGYSHLQRQLFTSGVYLQRVALLDIPSQKLLGQWIFEVFLHGTAHRSSAVDWIVALIDQKLDCAPVQLNLDVLGAYSFDDFCHLEIHNLD